MKATINAIFASGYPVGATISITPNPTIEADIVNRPNHINNFLPKYPNNTADNNVAIN